MKMNASLFPYRCDVSSPVSLVSVPGRAFSMRQSLSAGWVMDTFIDEATKRDSQHRSPNHLTLDRILSKDPDSPVKPVMESEISVRPGHNIDRGPSCQHELSSDWSPPLQYSLSLVPALVRSICEVCPVWSPSCELCELLSFPRYNRARDHLY